VTDFADQPYHGFGQIPCRHLGSLTVLLVFFWGTTGFGQRPVTQALRIDQAPELDGRLDDDCWFSGPVLDAFTQVEPVEGAAPTERTTVRFRYTQSRLYIGIRCYDSDPNQIRATQMQHDGDLGADDLVLVAFDTFDRKRDGYYFVVNPAGARVDGLIENFYEMDKSWDTVWEAKTRIDAAGWTAEMAIPFTSFSFDPQGQQWGCNVGRVVRRKQETVRWTVLSVAKHVTLLSEFGSLQGFADINQGLGLEVKPFLSLKYRDSVDGSEEGWEVKPGGDLTYYVTPSLKVNGTVNTDFAEVEVDDRRVNLSRFPLFYPEKRDFFLQDSSLFTIGGLNHSLVPYYSRRIGLSADGQPVDIRYGGRVTGRVNGTSVAVLDVEQDGYEDVDPSNLFVGRVTQRVFKESNVGLIATHGDPRSNDKNTLVGADFAYLNTRLPNNKQLVGRAWFMGTDSEARGTSDVAFGGDLDWPNEPFDFHLFFRQIGDDFDPAMGFVRRRGVRQYLNYFSYFWRPNGDWIRRIRLGTYPGLSTDLDNQVVEEDWDIISLSFYSPAEDRISLRYSYYGDLLEDPFEMITGITIPAGRYRYTYVRPSFYSSETRPVSVGFGYRYGDYYTGQRTDYDTVLDWRPSRYATLGLGYDLQQIRLPEGDADVRVAGTHLNLSLNPDVSWNTRLQYDNQTEDLGLNSRVRWTYRPGSDIYLVANQGWDVEEQSAWQRLDAEWICKVGATFRF
jgi:hypothetical protein